MNNEYKSKTILNQIAVLKKLPKTYEISILISKLKEDLEKTDKNYFKFNYVKHHMNIDIYEMLGKELYGHFKRLLDTMNENNVIDLDSLDLKRASKFNVQKSLLSFGIIKQLKKENNVNKKLYMNPLFGLRNRIGPDEELKKEFAEINQELYKIKL